MHLHFNMATWVNIRNPNLLNPRDNHGSHPRRVSLPKAVGGPLHHRDMLFLRNKGGNHHISIRHNSSTSALHSSNKVKGRETLGIMDKDIR